MQLIKILRFLPYVLIVLAYFYGVNVGKKGERVVYQDRIIEAGERHADIEKRQNEIITNRANYDIIKRLQSGGF